jgi:lysophospholipase L1-like esterase
LKTIAIYSAIIIATLASAELLARIWDWSPREGDLPAGDGLGRWRYDFAYGGAGDLVANQDGHWVIWFHRPYHVQTNSLGLRNTEEPSNNAFRILAVGDSQTFGPYLANEDTWPAWTENYLRQHYGDAGKVQVFNAGIAGYTILDELAYLKQKGAAFSPKLVVLAVFENDLDDLRKEKNQYIRRPTDPPRSRISMLVRELGRKSALISVFDQLRNRIKLAAAHVDIRRGEVNPTAPAHPSPPPASSNVLARRYGELFRETVALLKSRGIALAVIFIPGPDAVGSGATSVMEPVIRTLALETGTPYLDLTTIMSAERDPEARLYLLQKDARTGNFAGNGHLSREGNAAIGRAVADWLASSQLIPR